MALKLFFLLLLLTMVSVLDGQTLGGPMHGKAVVCYVSTWAAYRPGKGAFTINNLEPSLCTHLVYAFAGLDEATDSIKSLDPWQDLARDYGKDGYNKMVGLKTRYPHLKVTVAIGGWNEGSTKYSNMAADPARRAKFVKSVMAFLEVGPIMKVVQFDDLINPHDSTYKFDGLDLDWEYPSKRGGRPEDKANYVALVKDLKDAFQERGYILTAALGAGKDTMESAYDLAKLSRYLDLIHMMCYDYHGTWDRVVGANAPLKGYSGDDVLNIEYTIKYMLSHGVSPYKLVLGVPLYGRTFVLTNPEVEEVKFGDTAVKEQGFQGPFTKENGFMGYNEICLDRKNASSKWRYYWHSQSQTPYLRDEDRIISFDDARSIAAKVKTAIDYGLGGVMVWSIDTDDFRGDCEMENDAYVDFLARYNDIVDDPLLKKVMKDLNLPDTNRQTLSKRSYYTSHHGRLHLDLPEPSSSNYQLMWTINEAATLALEERKIISEMERAMRENEIEDASGGASKTVAGFSVASIVFLVVFVLL